MQASGAACAPARGGRLQWPLSGVGLDLCSRPVSVVQERQLGDMPGVFRQRRTTGRIELGSQRSFHMTELTGESAPCKPTRLDF